MEMMMAGSVIRRLGTTIEDRIIIHNDAPATWEDADKLAGGRVDRRCCYAIIPGGDFGDLNVIAKWTAGCSGCDGGGCEECGYRGKVRRAHWVPYLPPKSLAA
jgi:hypothetical protein